MKNPQIPRHSLRNWAFVLGFSWFVPVVGAYYVSYKPFAPEIELYLIGIAWLMITVFLIWCLVGGLGLRLIGVVPTSPLE